MRLVPILILLTAPVLASAAAPRLETTALTVTEGTNLAITRSPDGRSLAFDLQGTLFVLPAAGGEATPITDGLGDDRQPAWSPDGQRLAFQSYRSGNYHVWSSRPNGSDLRQQTDGPYDDREPVWSPDGQRLLFSSDRSGNYDVWELELASGKLTQLTKDHGNDYQPSYASDGKRIAFVSTRASGAGVYLREADGTQRLLAAAEGAAAPAWSPDDRSISFQTAGAGATTLSLVDVASGRVRVLSTAGEDVFPFRAVWTSADALLYTGDGKIRSRSTKDATPARDIAFRAPLTVAKPVYTPKKYDFTSTKSHPVKGLRGPAVSPDGTRVVFGALGDLWLLTIGKPKPERLTDDVFFDADPSWSPDGKQIVFSSDRAGGFDLHILDLASRAVRVLEVTPEEETLPTWLPNGKIAYISSLPSAFSGSLKVLDLATGKSETRVSVLFQPSQPSASPDGRFLTLAAVEAYSSRYREGVNKFALLDTSAPADPAGKLPVASPFPTETTGFRARNGPVWSPDGKHVVYVKEDFLWLIDVDAAGYFTGAPRQLTKQFSESPTWTADAKTIVYLGDDRLRRLDVASARVTDIPLELTWSNRPATGVTVIHAGRLFDGRNEKLLTNVDLVVEGNRIKAIRPHSSAPVPAGARVIDASTQTVLPGLFERHAHFWASSGETLGRLWLTYGITAVRQPGTDPLNALDHRESWLSGRRPGPFEFFSGPLTDGGRVYYGTATSVTSPAALDRQLARAERLDYDLIKTYVRLPDALQQRATEAAHRLGIAVSSHEIYPAARYGVDGVEHLGATSRRGYSPKTSALGNAYDDVIQIISRSGLVITPTLSLQGGFNVLTGRDPAIIDTPQFNQLFPAIYRDTIRTNVRSPRPQVAAALANFPRSGRVVKKLTDAGATITAGTDSPIIPFGVTLHVELWSYVEGAGLTPFQALQTATLNAARSLHVDDQLGTLEVGKIANVLVVDGNPLEHIRDTQRVRHVLVNGHPYTIEELLAGPVRSASATP